MAAPLTAPLLLVWVPLEPLLPHGATRSSTSPQPRMLDKNKLDDVLGRLDDEIAELGALRAKKT
jgi:hypothetical protein